MRSLFPAFRVFAHALPLASIVVGAVACSAGAPETDDIGEDHAAQIVVGRPSPRPVPAPTIPACAFRGRACTDGGLTLTGYVVHPKAEGCPDIPSAHGLWTGYEQEGAPATTYRFVPRAPEPASEPYCLYTWQPTTRARVGYDANVEGSVLCEASEAPLTDFQALYVTSYCIPPLDLDPLGASSFSLRGEGVSKSCDVCQLK